MTTLAKSHPSRLTGRSVRALAVDTVTNPGDKDIACPVCETRHNLSEGATAARKREPKVEQHTWALKGLIEKASKAVARHVVQVLGAVADEKPTRPIRLLHLSDLHFDASTPVAARLQWLLDGLKGDGGLRFRELDYLVVSGDFTDKACPEGFAKAHELLSGLTQSFALVPPNMSFVLGRVYIDGELSAGIFDFASHSQGMDNVVKGASHVVDGVPNKSGDALLDVPGNGRARNVDG
jgi:hypothetical protein